MTTSHPLLDALLKGLLAPLPGLALTLFIFAAPIFILGYIAHRRKRRYKEEAEEPFTDQPLRPPGESLRVRIEEISGEFDEVLLTITFIGMSAALITLMSPASLRVMMGITMAGMSAIIYIRSGRKLFTLQRNLWNHRLGFAGERVVGEALNQLLADGFRVFHDVPFDGYNIDHVIVGSSGVYAVETKTRRKRANLRGVDKARVVYNGDSLEYPEKKFTSHGIIQAKRNAESLAKWLTRATGEPTQVKPMLVLPGWFVVNNCSNGALKVLNEKQIVSSFPNPRFPLTPDRIQRIAHQLTERCRIPKDAKPSTRMGVQFATKPADAAKSDL